MKYKEMKGRHSVFRIYLSSSDRAEHHELSKTLMQKAGTFGLSGCTIHFGKAGYGESRVIHDDFPSETAVHLPLVFEFIEEPKRGHEFLDGISNLIESRLIAEEDLMVVHHSPGDRKGKAES
jgi:uncharacterized protein